MPHDSGVLGRSHRGIPSSIRNHVAFATVPRVRPGSVDHQQFNLMETPAVGPFKAVTVVDQAVPLRHMDQSLCNVYNSPCILPQPSPHSSARQGACPSVSQPVTHGAFPHWKVVCPVPCYARHRRARPTRAGPRLQYGLHVTSAEHFLTLCRSLSSLPATSTLAIVRSHGQRSEHRGAKMSD